MRSEPSSRAGGSTPGLSGTSEGRRTSPGRRSKTSTRLPFRAPPRRSSPWARSNQTRQAMSDSSWGPCRDGRPKPTVTAPGSSISAAGKGTGTATDSRSGTSMAAPHVAGAVALLFSRRADQCAKNPSLRQWNAAQVEKALAHMSQSFTGTWNVDTGYGHLDAEAFLLTFG